MYKKMLFAPSLMCMDLLNVKEQLWLLNERCDIYHFDIMDGTYVKNFSLAPAFLEAIKPFTTKPIDAHLMVLRPQDHIEVLAKAGADYISPQCDTITRDAFRVIQQIKMLGCKAGIVMNPADPIESILPYISRLDKITVLTVDPGFAGQKFVPEMLDKIRRLVEIRKDLRLNYLIEIDGSCNKNTYKCLHDAGADVLIVGSSGLFNLAENLEDAWNCMMKQYDDAVCAENYVADPA